MTRRRFLAFSGVTAAGALAAGATQVSWDRLVSAAATTPLDPEAGVLVVVTLYGGNDGLNTVIPAGDPAYAAARADLAYRPEETLDLGEDLGLNPGLAGLHGLWQDKRLAIVRGVGYPQADRSHFRSMAIWQTAAPETPVTTGWLGRWLDLTPADPLRAVSVDSLIPPLLAGNQAAAASFPLRGPKLPTDAVGRAVARLGKPDRGDGIWQARAAAAYAHLQVAATTLGATRAEEPDASGSPEDDPADQGASAGGAGQLGAQLDLVATLIEMGVPTRVYSVSLGGFDTHADERGTQQGLLTQLDAALSRFSSRLHSSERGGQVVTMVYSEFGRRVGANASDGTDHGTAGPVFVLGRGVSGGFHGAEPSLTDLDGGDLRATTDFRSVYATLLDRVLGADPGEVLNGWDDRLERLLV